MILEGVTTEAIDRVLTDYGFAVGNFIWASSALSPATRASYAAAMWAAAARSSANRCSSRWRASPSRRSR